MCLGVPAKILEIYEKDGLQMARVDFGGVMKEVNLSYCPEAECGQYVLVHRKIPATDNTSRRRFTVPGESSRNICGLYTGQPRQAVMEFLPATSEAWIYLSTIHRLLKALAPDASLPRPYQPRQVA